MTLTNIPRVVAGVEHPALAYAGFATGLSLDGIECLIVTATTLEAVELMRAIGVEVDLAGTKAVGVFSRDDLNVL